MSPRTATFLTALGLLAAGAPLPFLLHTQEHEHHHACCGHRHEHAACAATADAAEYLVPATVQSSAPLRSLKLMLGDRLLAETSGTALWEPTLTLPAAETYDIELVAEWEEDAPHALTLTLDVPRRDTRSLTRWGEKNLRTLLRFSW